MRSSSSNVGLTSRSSKLRMISPFSKAKTWWFLKSRRSLRSPKTKSSYGTTTGLSTTLSSWNSANRTDSDWASESPKKRNTAISKECQRRMVPTTLPSLCSSFSAPRCSPGVWKTTSRIRLLSLTRTMRSFGTSKGSSSYSVKIESHCQFRTVT